MDWLLHSDIPHLIDRYGYLAVAGMVGLESLGLPLPGETTLVAAALYAGSTHALNIELVIMAAFIGAVVGDSIGYWIGWQAGLRLLVNYGHYVHITERKIKLGRYLFWRHGGKVVFFGRFVTVLRALAAFLAGANRMAWPRFLLFNANGGFVWATLYGGGAYVFGEEIRRLSGPIAIAALSAAAVAAIAGAILLRRHGEQLENEAERKFPGPLRKPRRAD